MLELLIVGLLAGVVAGISPCVLPVLPVVLVAGASAPVDGDTALDPSATDPDGVTHGGARTKARESRERSPLVKWWGHRSGAFATAAGVVVSFSVLVLAGSELISLLDLPEDFLRDAGVVVLVVLGVGLLVPPLGDLLERPFARIAAGRPNRRRGSFVVGLALGLVFAPCAGPVLAAITVVGASHHVGFTAVALTVAFAVGAAVPLFVVALAGEELAKRSASLRRHAPLLRRVSGVVFVVMAIAIVTNVFSGLQRDVPGYTSALQNNIEGSSSVRQQLGALTGNNKSSLANCNPYASGFVDCGPAPNFTGITAWLNTPDGKPLTLRELRGHVVLVDFWTYSCINCERTLPHVEAWYKEYSKDGLVVVGVHTPEFDFEHVVSNVRAESAALGVHYPVAIDDAYRTWDAYDNEYWPAEYLIDENGDVRHVHFGEGDYSTTESLIRQLLLEARPGLVLPRATDVPDKTPVGELSPETYVGYKNEEYLDPQSGLVPNEPTRYAFPTSLPTGAFALSGVWNDHSEEATSGGGAELELAYLAQDVYLVLGGRGTLQVSVNGGDRQVINVNGIPRLYTLVHSSAFGSGTLLLQASPGIEAYDFTFG